jgi:ADP-heptose:LPS heptosyltransferase
MVNKQKILIIKLSSLGDVLHTTPLIETISSKYDVYFLTFEQNYNLLKNNHKIKKILLIKDNFSLIGVMKNVLTFIKIFFLRIDVCINLHKLYKLNLIFKMMRIQKRMGVIKPKEKNNTYLNVTIEFNQKEHHIIQYCKFAKELNLQSSEYKMKYYPKINELNIDNFNLERNNYIVCCPGGAKNKWAEMKSKRWTQEKYVDLFRKVLAKDSKIKVVLIGGKEDIEINATIQNIINNENIIDLTYRLSFDELFYLIKNAFCYLGNDSFLLHFASTTGVKTIGIFGATSGNLLSPLCERDFFIQATTQCSPCYNANEAYQSLAYKCTSYRCINSVQVDSVYDFIFS